MKKQLIIGLTFLALIITACGGQPTQTLPGSAASTQLTPIPTSANTTTNTASSAAQASGVGVSFAKDVMPIFQNNCINCHGGEQMKAGLDLSTYAGLEAGSFNGPVIVVGNSTGSFLVQQVVNGKMPKRGSKLTAEQIQVISNWIDAGALNN